MFLAPVVMTTISRWVTGSGLAPARMMPPAQRRPAEVRMRPGDPKAAHRVPMRVAPEHAVPDGQDRVSGSLSTA
ncbi:hypothetical protein GCM10009818_19130 [Nakamurella flavida]